MAHAGGRPTTYDPKYCDELIEFFDAEPYTDIEIPHMGPTGEFKWMDYKRMANRLPTVRNFAKKIGVSFDTFYEWLKVYPEFSDAYIRAQELRKWFLIENGLNGTYNPIFAKFTAVNITDMRDKISEEITGKDGGPIALNVIAAAGYNHLSRPLSLDATSEGSVIRGQPPLQGLSVPPTGSEDNNSDHRDNQAGTP